MRPGQAERRALSNTSSDVFDNIVPIIEIIKGRKKTVDNIEFHPIDKYFSDIKKIFNGKEVCIDVTSTPSLSSQETTYFYSPDNGYNNWINFLTDLKEECVFSKIIPCILFNYDDPNYESNLRNQIERLVSEFGQVMYRNKLEDEGCYDDFEFLPSDKTVFLLDCEYVPQASYINAADKAIIRLKNIKENWKNLFSEIILAATSFPNNISNLMKDGESASFSLDEILIYDKIKNELEWDNLKYADYGSVNPVRNDDVVMANGWVPRIDVPLSDRVFVYRERRPSGTFAYKDTYINVARDCVKDSKFPNNLDDNWGIRQIKMASSGLPPSLVPNFWIAVRMNIHLRQQVNRLKSLNYFSDGKQF